MNTQGKLARVIWGKRMRSQQPEESQDGEVSGGGKARMKARRQKGVCVGFEGRGW